MSALPLFGPRGKNSHRGNKSAVSKSCSSDASHIVLNLREDLVSGVFVTLHINQSYVRECAHVCSRLIYSICPRQMILQQQ